MKKRSWHKGFTLLESLIVLFITSTLLAFPTLMIKEWQKNLAVHQFFNTFEKRLIFTQQMAILHDYPTYIYFDETKQLLKFESNNKPVDNHSYHLKLPTVLFGSGPAIIKFNSKTGNNGRLSKYVFRWLDKKQEISYQFQLGSGRIVKNRKEK
ncbi:type II secretion system GspH family protein [Melissococcus plutonius]|uniref:competence type IV pilus minor pilin ComGD n=1 Tax=Melissococcus plutonius TaxID=33970 RepID=UPI0021E5E7BA|nr:competence type IV pilus minor pilin ComGD [Melissococcus plutonius]MCV2499346.1 type II secretion system GspH family protein [Melissococcus plutonius]MCV2507890.1 type II secretion system GspH family protein [Melissococcus plutonius]